MANTNVNEKNDGKIRTTSKIMKQVLLESDKQITDMNQFWLEHIFMYLDLEDLLNVADSNKYLKLATNSPFIRKYGDKIDWNSTKKFNLLGSRFEN